MSKPTPNWQPLSALPLLSQMIGGMLKEATTQHQSLMHAQHKPYALDNHTVERVLQVYGEQQEFLWVYEEQFKRWRQESLTPAQTQKINRLETSLTQIQVTIEEILSIAHNLRSKTIETILGKSDIDLAIESFSLEESE